MITGLFGKTSEAKFITEIQQYNEELKLAINEDYTNNMGNRQNKFNIRRSNYNDENTFTDEMKTKVPSFNIKYANKLEIKEDKLHYIGEDEQERAWLAQAISVAGKLRISYVYENGTEAAPTYEQVIPDGSYEVESPTISGYEPDRYMVSGEIQGDTNITVTYYQPSQGLDYELLDDGTYTVAGIGSFTGECLIIPAKYNDIDVTQIKKEAFKNCQTIKTAVIPVTITKIASNSYIFIGCSNLESLRIDIENSLDAYEPYKFNATSIKHLELGENVKSIGIQTFQYYHNLEDITVFSNNITRLYGQSFAYCENLKEIKVSKDNSGYKSENGVLYSKDGKTLVLYPPTKTDGELNDILKTVEIIGESACSYNQVIKNIEIQSNIKSIKGNAFNYCNKIENLNLNAERVEGNYAFRSSSLGKIDIGPNVKFINGATFGNCTNLTDVTIYSEQLDVTGYQFMSCSSLKKFKLKENHSKYNEKDGVIYSKDWKTLYACPSGIEGEFNIPEGTNIVNGAAFLSSYPKLTKLTLPASITKADLSYISPLQNIYYNGTVEQWNSVTINKGGSTLKTVTCTDGTVNL